ncbi:gamma-glutamylcyclotransferase [Echinicola sp. CAU 1574]|uniref:Gamma-glutamylcyclotransferase n=1 Tax=Echinicola arenosa TaxID=2774144 RepID=A0ABR9AF56_9BACT|nr:gamma-glutamylcyclotransferase family protein [Echinicola arenosa]MBD8487346.1 gamma-glutamylcyclotransferase [Echinicola arenosa]
MNLIFVYGTLLKETGYAIQQLFHQKSAFVAEAFTYGKLFQVSYYPGLVLNPTSLDKVYGQIFRISEIEKVLQALDEYEEAGPSFPSPQAYKRTIITAYDLQSSEPMKCWAYLYNLPTENLKQIVKGKFK